MFLRQLMKGMTKTLLLLILAVYLTSSQPFRERELGLTKFQNTGSCLRNLYITDGEAYISTKYHEVRASTNYSFCIIRYLPESVATFIALYIVYIHPFAKMLFANIIFVERIESANTIVIKAKPHLRIKIAKQGMKTKKQTHHHRI